MISWVFSFCCTDFITMIFNGSSWVLEWFRLLSFFWLLLIRWPWTSVAFSFTDCCFKLAVLLYIRPLTSLGKSCQGSSKERRVKAGKLSGPVTSMSCSCSLSVPSTNHPWAKCSKYFFHARNMKKVPNSFLRKQTEFQKKSNQWQLIISSPWMSICYWPWTQTRTLCSCPSSAATSLCVLGNGFLAWASVSNLLNEGTGLDN